MKTIAIIAAAAALGVAGAAAAQNAVGRALVESLFGQFEAQQGLSPTAANYGQLAAGRSQSFNFNLAAGPAVIIGLCDENCSDVDLIVRDASGREVGSDVLEDDAPVVILESAAAGRYAVEVQMPGCTSNCNWGVRLYQ